MMRVRIMPLRDGTAGPATVLRIGFIVLRDKDPHHENGVTRLTCRTDDVISFNPLQLGQAILRRKTSAQNCFY